MRAGLCVQPPASGVVASPSAARHLRHFYADGAGLDREHLVPLDLNH